jgi:hypothetical protein
MRQRPAIKEAFESEMADQDSTFSNIVDLLGYFARIVRKLVEAIVQNPSGPPTLYKHNPLESSVSAGRFFVGNAYGLPTMQKFFYEIAGINK